MILSKLQERINLLLAGKSIAVYLTCKTYTPLIYTKRSNIYPVSD